MNPLRVLLIEDSEDDATLIFHELRRDARGVVTERVATAEDLRAALSRQAWDLITCDYNLPGFGAMAALALIRERDRNVPVIVVSGEIGEELTVDLIRAGADDLVLKNNLGRLSGAVEHALRGAEDRRRRAAAEAALREESRISAALARVGEVCVAGIETAPLLQAVCRTTAEVLGCDYSHTILWDAETGFFAAVAGHDDPQHWERVRALRFPLALIADRAAQLRQHDIVVADVADLAHDPAGAAVAMATEMTASVYVPLWRGEEVIGIHAAGYRRPIEGFAPWQCRVAAGIGHLVSLALDNAHLVDRLTRTDRIKSDFLATMSHELRTPLHHIIGYNDLLLDQAEQLTADQAQMLRTIGRSSRDLLSLVNGVLDAQRLEAAPPAAPEAIDVAELLRVLATATSRTCPNDLHVSCQLPPDLPPVRADPAKLKAVLQNLIGNAVKFTPHGSVAVSAEPRNDGVLFTVADTGIGIPPETLPIIFEPFRQGDSSSTRQHGGVGLGLYIVQREVDRLGGEVAVESTVGRGSTFRVWIPCEPRSRTEPAVNPQGGAPAVFAEVLDATSDLVHTATPDGRLLYANRAWLAAFGYQSDELPALSVDDIVHPQSRGEIQRARQRALAGDPVHGLCVKCVAKDGRIVEVEGSLRGSSAKGAPTGTVFVGQNVTERDEVLRRAETRRQLLEAILGALPVGVWTVDATGRITHGNPAAQRIWGGARYLGIEEYDQYKGWFAASGRRVAPEEWAAACAIQRGETTINEELEIESFDGIRRTILQSAIPLRDPAGATTGAIVVDHDITAFKEMEQALRESEERFRAVVERAADGIFVHDLFGFIVEINPESCKSLGYSRDELIGRPLTDIDTQLDPDRARQDLLQLESGAPVLIDTVHRRKDGSTFPVEVRAVRIAWNGQPHVLGTCRDVTERKEAERALRVAEERLRSAVEASRSGLWDHDLTTDVTHFSTEWKAQIGYADDEIADHYEEWRTRVHPDDLPRTLAIVRRCQAPPWPDYEAEFRMRHKDGSYRWILARGRVLRDANERPWHMLGAQVDITERKQAEEALRETREALEIAVMAARAGLWEWDLQTGESRYSESWRSLFGYTLAEFDGSMEAWLKIVHPDDLDSLARILSTAMEATSSYETEFRLRHQDGTCRWVLSRAMALRDAAGTPRRVLGAHLDITDRKQMELALREAEASLRFAAESAKIAFWKADLRALTIRFSSGWSRVLGRDESTLELTALWDLVHPDDRAKTTEAMQEHFQGRAGAYETEQRMLHTDGSYRWVLSRGVITGDAEGQPVDWFGADIDITERKELEQALRRSEEQYRHLVEDITDVIYATDREGRVTYMSPVAERLYGYAPAEVQARPFSDFIFPEDLPAVVEGFLEATSGNPQPHDHRVVTKAGDVRWVRNHTRTIMQDGQIVGLRGVMSDVTDRKQAEDALRALTTTLEQEVADRARELVTVNDRLRLITDNMLDMLSQVSLEGVFQYVSPAHERILGYAPQEMLGRSVLEFLHPDDIGRVSATIEAVIGSASSGQAEFRYRHADGHYLWLETVGRLLLDDQGVPTAAVLNGRDVTERMRAEEEIRRRNEELERFNRLAVGRELRMIEIKERANELARRLGQAPPYPLAFRRAGDGLGADHHDADGSALAGSGQVVPTESRKA